MSPSARLMLLSIVAAAVACIVIPVQAGVAQRTGAPGALLLADDQQQTPKEQQTPPPEPNGCPFRNGKLELIA